MPGPRHHRRSDPQAPLVDLADVLRDDDVVERLRRAGQRADAHAAVPPADLSSVGAGGRRRASGRHRASAARVLPPPVDPVAGQEVFALLQEWRSDLTAMPLPPVPVVPAAVRSAARRRRWSATAGRITRARSVRPALAISGALAGLLLGSTVISAKEATPEEPLFALTTIFWPQEAASKSAMGEAWEAMNKLSAALNSDDGDLSERLTLTANARTALAAVEVDDRPESWQSVMWAAERAGSPAPTVTASTSPSPIPVSATTAVATSAGTGGPATTALPAGRPAAPVPAQTPSSDTRPATTSSDPGGPTSSGSTGTTTTPTLAPSAPPSSSTARDGTPPDGVPAVPNGFSTGPAANTPKVTSGAAATSPAPPSSGSGGGGSAPVSTAEVAATRPPVQPGDGSAAPQSPVDPSDADRALTTQSARPVPPTAEAVGGSGTGSGSVVAGPVETLPSAGVPQASAVSRDLTEAPPAPAPSPPPAAEPEPTPPTAASPTIGAGAAATSTVATAVAAATP